MICLGDLRVGKILLVADKKTASCFKIAGLSEIHIVQNSSDAKKILQDLSNRDDVEIIIITTSISNANIPILEKLIELERPRIIPIPDLKGESTLEVDFISSLIKSKSGIEFKL